MGLTFGAGALLSGTLLVAPAGAADGTFTDTSVADFAAGEADSDTAVVDSAGGEVLLRPQEGAEFFGDTLPTDWSASAWNTDGAAVVGGGSLTVDGARAQVEALTGPGHSVEFVATFPVGAPFAHVGFGVTFDDAPWGMFSTGADGSQLIARTNTGNGPEELTGLGADLLGEPHLFRVTWDADGFSYAVDGAPVATHVASVAQELRPLVSDYTTGGGAMVVDWLRLTPYSTSGQYTSRVFDAEALGSWSADWDAQASGETEVALLARTGNSAEPDESWSAWTVVGAPGGEVTGTGRYAQYRVALAGDGTRSPAVTRVTLSYTVVVQNQAPTAQDRSVATAEDTAVAVRLVATDPDGDPVSYVVVDAPTNGTLTGTGDKRRYTPAAGFTGTDTFTYRASDSTGASNLATVTIAVLPLRQPAITGFSPGSGAVGTGVQITGTGFLGTQGVAFGRVRAPFQVKSDTLIVARVPAGATSGRITVGNAEFRVRSSSPFTVTP